MPFNSTQLAVTSTGITVISTATTWGHNRGASLQEPTRLKVSNLSTAVNCYLGVSTASSACFPLPPIAGESIQEFVLIRPSDVLFAISTANMTIGVIADNQ